MRVGVLQFAPQFHARTPNWERTLRWMEGAPADVLVVPELASCGYCYRTREEIGPFTDTPAALKPVERIARERGRLIVGGFAERARDGLFNSAYVVSPSGTRIYRKIHLWNYETAIFGQGTRPVLVDFAGHRFGIEVCYDLQFPELSGWYSRHGAQALLIPMAWPQENLGPDTGLQSFSMLASATAYARGIFVVVANRVGPERGSVFPGESSISDPFGRITRLGPGEGELIVELDFAQIDRAKRPNPRNELDSDGRMTIGVPRKERARRGSGSRRVLQPVRRSVQRST